MGGRWAHPVPASTGGTQLPLQVVLLATKLVTFIPLYWARKEAFKTQFMTWLHLGNQLSHLHFREATLGCDTLRYPLLTSTMQQLNANTSRISDSRELVSQPVGPL